MSESRILLFLWILADFNFVSCQLFCRMSGRCAEIGHDSFPKDFCDLPKNILPNNVPKQHPETMFRRRLPLFLRPSLPPSLVVVFGNVGKRILQPASQPASQQVGRQVRVLRRIYYAPKFGDVVCFSCFLPYPLWRYRQCFLVTSPPPRLQTRHG